MLGYTIKKIRFYNGVNNNQQVIEQAEEIEPQEIDISKWDTEKIEIYTDEAGMIVPVPKGYVVSGKDDEHTVNTGLVIYEGDVPVTNDNAWEESKTRNQWVWVPVPEPSRIYEVDENGKKKSKLYDYTSTGRTLRTNNNYEPGILQNYDSERFLLQNNMQTVAKERLLENLQVEFEESIESIEKYGGYYIGRYETGNVSKHIPVVQRMNTDINYMTWYNAYNNIKYISLDSNIKVTTIFGSLWDETIQWFVESGNKSYEEIANPKEYGNYVDSIFEYKTINGKEEVKQENKSNEIPAGSTEYTNVNNIYDMAGNVHEWTMEGYGSSQRISRGGSCVDNAVNKPISYRYQYYPANYVGVRACMYIKNIE